VEETEGFEPAYCLAPHTRRATSHLEAAGHTGGSIPPYADLQSAA